jgi:NFU1 iron-sulfur cluster scaffold homolog, mitochondrial
MADAHIRFQPTPNPNAGKFSLGRPAVPGGGSRSYFSREQAASDAVAAPLFEIPGVASVFMVADFVTVTKTEDADWGELIPSIVEALEQAG